MKKSITLSIILPAMLLISACDGKKEEDIELNQVPANIIEIVQSTLPGISLTEAEKETKGETVVYELEGKMLDGREYEIKVREDGLLIKIKLED
ncbi:MAG TPA: hypothetical protein ENJ11_03965 [Gammaproteobacteria bacterium]|nr:hypothetical protein [Gammaproteobacteria bacterium]